MLILGDGDSCAGVFANLLYRFAFSSYDASTVAVVDQHAQRHVTAQSLFTLPFIRLFNPLPSTRQHPSYGDCLEVKREYYQNSSVLDCVTRCSQSTAHLYEQFLQVK